MTDPSRLALAVLTASTLANSAIAKQKTVNQAIDEVLGDHAPYERVILATQKAIKSHDAPTVAMLVRYPIRVTIGKTKRTIRSPAGFVAHYDAIVTPAIAKAVVADKYEDLMVNQNGVMFGQGEVWISGACADPTCKTQSVKIVTIQPRSPLSPPLP